MKFENLYIECENLEHRDEVFSVCLENGLELYNSANKYQSVRVTGGVFFTIDWKPNAKATKIDYSQFMEKYGKSEMKKAIEKAMADLNMGREELSSALGMSRPYITKMLTRPQSEKTQAKVIGMIDKLIKDKNMKSMSCQEITGVSVDCEKIQEQQKTIKELNQAIEYKDQLLAKNEDDLHKATNRANSYKEDNSKLGEKIDYQLMIINKKDAELLACEKLTTELSTQVEILKRKNKDINICYAIVCVILTVLVVWGFYV